MFEFIENIHINYLLIVIIIAMIFIFDGITKLQCSIDKIEYYLMNIDINTSPDSYDDY